MVSKLGHSIRLHVGGNTVTEVSWSGQRPDRRIGVEKQQCGRLDYKAHSNVKREKHEASRYHTTPQCPLPKLRTSSIAVASTRDTVAGRISPKQIVLSATIAFLRPLLPHSVARVFGVSVSELTCVLGKGREDSLGHVLTGDLRDVDLKDLGEDNWKYKEKKGVAESLNVKGVKK
ncbi:hypothetical protein G4B88_019637 [Cannabis sativa]|uniref:Uncharacterized protein n=1 Tax=Cannabis sativa TaxID=3483 RepID=A0A7J6HRM7_CANSA|nr:hypothetical protein G4B88_019637 [Cannabis sativa]